MREYTEMEKNAFIAAAAKAIGKGIGSLAGGAGKAVGKGIARSFKKSPIMTTINGAFGIGAAKNAIGTAAGRKFTQGAANLNSYNTMKQTMPKYGEAMDKEAGVLGTLKSAVGYGGSTSGTPASLMGLAAMAGISLGAGALMQPTLSTMGDNIQRRLFPVSDRIKADEEMAKKELGIAATTGMEDYLKRQKLEAKRQLSAPILNKNLERFAGNDPIISDFVRDNPNNYASLRSTLDSVYSFAPDIATNQHAAQSILREVAMSPDGGLNYNTIKLIADAQKSISQSRTGK